MSLNPAAIEQAIECAPRLAKLYHRLVEEIRRGGTPEHVAREAALRITTIAAFAPSDDWMEDEPWLD